jgi:adenine phosphoribosyltransferase
LKIPFVMVRKQGKLPNSVSGAEYFKEYQGVSASGGDTLCAPRNVIPNGARVLVIDDLMATGVRLSYLPLLT